jgi:hypothetical protein
MRTAIVTWGLFLAAGCGASHVGQPAVRDSETHFLSLCASSCEDGLTCVCGVCTRACEEASDCSELANDASCSAPTANDKRACGRVLPATVCEAECSDHGECAAVSPDHRCDQGVCRAGPLATDACPARPAPACDDEEHLTTERDEDGCANPICAANDICTLPLESDGFCDAAFAVYTFVAERGRCELRTYGGCGATENNFETEQACWESCEADNWGASCLEVWEPIDFFGSEPDALAEATIERLEGAHRAEMVFPDGSRSPLELTLSGARAYRVRTADNPNYAPADVPPPCLDTVQIEADATFETDDGRFRETWSRLRFEVTEDGRARATSHVKRPGVPSNDLENATLRGSYVPEIEPGTCDLFMSIAISVSAAVFSGEISFLIANDACEDVGDLTGVGQGGPPGPTWLAITEAVSSCETEGCCELLAIDECALVDGCELLEGRRLNDDDAENLCLEPRPAGCMARDMACEDAETQARDPQGACWWFSTGCRPASFTALDDSDPTCNSSLDDEVPLCP